MIAPPLASPGGNARSGQALNEGSFIRRSSLFFNVVGMEAQTQKKNRKEKVSKVQED